MKLHFAPLQGHADNVYLKHHAHIYGGVDACYTPFIRIEKGEPRRQDLARLDKAVSAGLDIVPQIIFRSADEFDALVRPIKQKGFARIDLNLGCPYPMQTGKGRGAAMIVNAEVMEKVASAMNDDAEVSYSVKMRLGMSDAHEWERLMPILNGVNLSHVTVHPRVATQMYEGELYADEFARIVEASRNKVVYNGDLLTPADIDRIGEVCPGIDGVMVGRGFLARPSLGAEWRGGREWSADERFDRLMQFHQAVFDEYASSLCGQAQILQKIKPFWEYLEPEIGHKNYKAIKKATSLEKYNNVISQIWKHRN